MEITQILYYLFITIVWGKLFEKFSFVISLEIYFSKFFLRTVLYHFYINSVAMGGKVSIFSRKLILFVDCG